MWTLEFTSKRNEGKHYKSWRIKAILTNFTEWLPEDDYIPAKESLTLLWKQKKINNFLSVNFTEQKMIIVATYPASEGYGFV